MKNKLFCVLLFIHTLNSHADIPLSQASKLILKLETQDEARNIAPTDKDKLIKEYANFETYRPDSFSDASRNPFGPKRYKVEDLVN